MAYDTRDKFYEQLGDGSFREIAPPIAAPQREDGRWIIYPETRFVSADTLRMWYSDGLANGEVITGATTLDEMCAALADAGFVTFGNSPRGDRDMERDYRERQYAEARDRQAEYEP